VPSHEADEALSSQPSELTQQRGVDHDAAALELKHVPRQDQSMGLLQASSATKSIQGLRARQMFVDWSAHGQLYVPRDHNKQERSKAMMMMLWFSSMATPEEKVGKGILKRGPS
jgi:hypothetical protein